MLLARTVSQEIFCPLRTGQDIFLGIPHLKMHMVGGWIGFMSCVSPVHILLNWDEFLDYAEELKKRLRT